MKRDRFVNERLEAAKTTFTHYFNLALPNGLPTDGASEIEEAVEAIFEAAELQARLELGDSHSELEANLSEKLEESLQTAQTREDYARRVRKEGL